MAVVFCNFRTVEYAPERGKKLLTAATLSPQQACFGQPLAEVSQA